MSSFQCKQSHIDIFSMELEIIHRHDDKAERARQYIASIYHKNYQATICPNPDIIIASTDKASGDLLACAGISFASATQSLFSERYLNVSLDEAVLQRTNYKLVREQVVEIGALASDNPGAAAELIRLMPIISWFMGSKAILCTSTCRLRKLLDFHQVPFSLLTNASPDQLSAEERAEWGSYYDQMPQTGVILLEQCSHLFNHFCGRLVFSEFDRVARSTPSAPQVAA